MKQLRRIVEPIITLGVFVLALFLLHHELRHGEYAKIKEALLDIPRSHVVLALLLTVLNYLVLLSYDWLSVRYLRLPLSLAKTAVASFIGHVCSFNLGAVVGGTPIRYRLYTAYGLDRAQVFRLIALSSATFWIGFLVLAGCVFLLEPLGLPPALHMPFHTAMPLGVVLVALSLGYFLLSLRHAVVRWRDFEFAVPPWWLALLQLAIAATDLVIACGVLYVLMPESEAIRFVDLLAVYLLATIAVLFTHVPGGVGVLEVVVITLLAPEDQASVLGALLAFRVIYYLIPLALAMVLLAIHEWRAHRSARAAVVDQRPNLN